MGHFIGQLLIGILRSAYRLVRDGGEAMSRSVYTLPTSPPEEPMGHDFVSSPPRNSLSGSDWSTS